MCIEEQQKEIYMYVMASLLCKKLLQIAILVNFSAHLLSNSDKCKSTYSKRTHTVLQYSTV